MQFCKQPRPYLAQKKKKKSNQTALSEQQKKQKPFMQIPAYVFVFSAATFVRTAGVCFPTSVLRDYLSTHEGLGSTTATTLIHLQTHTKVI